VSSTQDPDENGHSSHLGPDHPAGSAVPPVSPGAASSSISPLAPATDLPADDPDDGLIIDLTTDVARITTADELATEVDAARSDAEADTTTDTTAADALTERSQLLNDDRNCSDDDISDENSIKPGTAQDSQASAEPSGLRVPDLFAPLLGAAAITFGAGVVFMAILSIGDLPMIAHPGILLIATAVVTAIVSVLFRSGKVAPASGLATVAIGVFIALGVVLMLLALSIQLREGDTDDARQSLALLVIAPVTMLIGFILTPAVKAARAMTVPGDAGAGNSRAASSLPRTASRVLSAVSLAMVFFGIAGVLLGILDATRGLAPTEAPYTLFAGAFAALGGLLLNGLSRIITSAPPVELSAPAPQPDQ